MNNQRTFVILLVGLLVLGGIAYFINTNPDAVANPTPTPVIVDSTKLFDFDPLTATSFTVLDRVKNVNFLAEQVANQVWQIREPRAAEGDGAQIRTAIASISTLFPSRTFKEGFDVTNFGVQKPDYLIEIKLGAGQTLKLEVGKKDVTGFGYYVRKSGSNDTYIVSSSALDIVLALSANPPYAPTPVPLTPALGTTPAPAATAKP